MNEVDTTQSQRDAVTLKILGAFFVVIGALVLFGTFWAFGNTKAVVVNLASGLILAGVGVVMMYVARRLRPEKQSV